MRRTYHYDEETKTMVEGPAPQRLAGSGDGWRFSDRLYSASPFAGADGTVINSRRKHREYMRRHGLTTADDFTNHWQDAAKKRAEFFEGRADREERKWDIARAMEKK